MSEATIDAPPKGDKGVATRFIKTTNWKMPRTYKGQTVLWYDGGHRGDANSFVGHVTGINNNQRSVSLLIMQTGTNILIERECVRNVDDPLLKDQDRIDNGSWEYCQDSMFRAMAGEPEFPPPTLPD